MTKIKNIIKTPDGFAGVVSLPLKKKHWIFQESGEPPAPLKIKSIETRIQLENMFRDVIKYAVRGTTASGTDMDFDPDALVQNFFVGMFGYYPSDFPRDIIRIKKEMPNGKVLNFVVSEIRKQAEKENAKTEFIMHKAISDMQDLMVEKEQQNMKIERLEKQLKEASSDGSKEQAYMIIEDIKKITGCESNDSLDIVESVEKFVKTVELQGNENVSFIRKIRELKQQLKESEGKILERVLDEVEDIITGDLPDGATYFILMDDWNKLKEKYSNKHNEEVIERNQ